MLQEYRTSGCRHSSSDFARLNALLAANRNLALDVRHGSDASNERARLLAVVRVRTNEVVGEARLELDDRLEVLDVFARKLDVERLDVVLQVLHLAAVDVLGQRKNFSDDGRLRLVVHLPANDGEDVRCLCHHVRKRNGGRRLETVLLCDLVERFGDLDFVFGLLA